MKRLIGLGVLLVILSGSCPASDQRAAGFSSDLRATIGIPIYCKITRDDFNRAKLEAQNKKIATIR